MVDQPVADLDAADTAAAVAAGVQTVVVAQCDELVDAAHWAMLHSPDGLPRAGSGPVALLGERAVVYGGSGTPEVAEFAAAELAPEAGRSVGQAKALIADAVDLQY